MVAVTSTRAIVGDTPSGAGLGWSKRIFGPAFPLIAVNGPWAYSCRTGFGLPGPLFSMPLARDQAVCLRTTPFSETSQIVTLLTREFGRIRLLAKGAKRTTKAGKGKFDGGLDLLDLGQAVFSHQLDKDLSLLTEWKLESGHPQLRGDLRALWLGLYAAETVDRLIEEHDPHPKLFDQMVRLLDRLADGAVREAVTLAFVMNVLRQVGVLPDFARATGGESVAQASADGLDMAFDAEESRMIVGEAAADAVRLHRHTVAVLPASINAILDLLRLARSGGNLPRIDRAAADGAHRLIGTHVQFQTGSKLRMLRYVLS